MSDSDGEGSAPPDVQGDAVPAATAGAAAAAPTAPTHPVWAAAAGRGAGSAAGRGGGNGSLFAPISMMELELRRRGDLDGASSTASDRGGKDKRHGGGKNKRRRKKRPQDYADSDDDEEEAVEADDASSIQGSEPDLAGAAFGGKRKASCVPCGSEASDDAMSVASSQKRAAHARAFPVSGVHCVGCALPAKVAPVVEFIQKNMANMSELSLFKMAAMVYLNKVAEPAEEEGVSVPVRSELGPQPHFLCHLHVADARACVCLLSTKPWHWKDIRDHFTLHAVDPKFQRFENIRTLGAMRKTLELQLLRRDAESGEMSLDKNNAEQIMKIITASSRELTLLYDATAPKKK